MNDEVVGWSKIIGLLGICFGLHGCVSTESPRSPTIPNPNLSSLEEMLRLGDLRGADTETFRLISSLYKQSDELPCADLLAIDKLWLKYSGDRFGFSLWQRMWEDNNVQDEQWIGDRVSQFCDRLGWDSCEVDYGSVNFSQTAQYGYFPTTVLPLAGEGYTDDGFLTGFDLGIKPGDTLFLGRNPGTYEVLASTVAGFFSRVKSCEL